MTLMRPMSVRSSRAQFSIMMVFTFRVRGRVRVRVRVKVGVRVGVRVGFRVGVGV